MRVIQVGLGDWGRNWATEILPTAVGVDVSAVVDRDPAKARPSEGGPGVPTFRTLDEAIAAVEADAVLVTVDISSHFEVTIAALEADKHVLVEKPLAPDLAQARRLVELAAERHRVLAVSQNYRYSLPAQLAVELLDQGVLGELRGISVDFRRFRQFDDTQSQSPLFDHSILTQIGIHHFDLMRALAREDAQRVFCATWNPPPSTSAAPAAASAVIEFNSGLVVTYRANIVAQGPQTPWSGTWRLECEGGDIVWEGPDSVQKTPGFVEVRPRPGSSTAAAGGMRALPQRPEDRLAVLETFVAAIRTGHQIPISGRNNLASVAILDAAFESSSTGRAKDIEQLLTSAALAGES
jgi:predicted dehydrogenase